MAARKGWSVTLPSSKARNDRLAEEEKDEDEKNPNWVRSLADSVSSSGLRAASAFDDDNEEVSSEEDDYVMSAPMEPPKSAPPPALPPRDDVAGPSAPPPPAALTRSLSRDGPEVQRTTNRLHEVVAEFMNIDVDKNGCQVLTRSMDVRRRLHLGSISEILVKLEKLIVVAYRNKDPRMRDLMDLRRDLANMKRHMEMLELRESQRLPNFEALGVSTQGSTGSEPGPSAPPAYFSDSSDSWSSSSSSEEEDDIPPADIRNSLAAMLAPRSTNLDNIRQSINTGVPAPSLPSDLKYAIEHAKPDPGTAPISQLQNFQGVASQDFECPICLDVTKASESVRLTCLHDFCMNCVEEYLEMKIGEADVLKITCPNPTCEYELTNEDISELVPRETYDRYNEFLFLSNLRANPHTRWCLDPKCGEPVVADPNVDCVKCPACGKSQCYHCRNEYHPGKLCAEAGDIVVREEDKEFFNWVKDHSDEFKPCPKCNTTTEKTAGCNHITCVVCKYQWCWLCGLEYKSGHYSRGRCKGKQFSNMKTRARRREKILDDEPKKDLEHELALQADKSPEDIEREKRIALRKERFKRLGDAAANVGATGALAVGTVVGGAAIVGLGAAGVGLVLVAGPAGVPLFYVAGGVGVGIKSAWKKRNRWRRRKRRERARRGGKDVSKYEKPASAKSWLDN